MHCPLSSSWRHIVRRFGFRTAGRRRDAVPIEVENGFPVRLVCPADVDVLCLRGTAWITTEGDRRDVVLEVGQRHASRRGDRLFITGMPQCELRVASRASSNC